MPKISVKGTSYANFGIIYVFFALNNHKALKISYQQMKIVNYCVDNCPAGGPVVLFSDDDEGPTIDRIPMLTFTLGASLIREIVN